MLKNFIKELSGSGPEGELIKTTLISLIASFAIFAVVYFSTLGKANGFIPKYGFYLFLSILSYAVVLPSIKHVRSYNEFPCMSGMMIGMTIGMISGFLPGFYIGATNGMFYGSVFGMAIGILFGAWNGKSGGVMGVMEGIMAGFMGGLMGAMTAVMTLNDHLRAISIIVFLVSAVIMFGLNYMIYKEARSLERKNKEDSFFIIFWSVVLTVTTMWLMVFGPRSPLFQ